MSSIAAVVSRTSKRAAALQTLLSRRGGSKASPGQRSRVEAFTPTSTATWSSGALQGGNRFANALFLKSCPHRVTSFAHRPHPLVSSVSRRRQQVGHGGPFYRVFARPAHPGFIAGHENRRNLQQQLSQRTGMRHAAVSFQLDFSAFCELSAGMWSGTHHAKQAQHAFFYFSKCHLIRNCQFDTALSKHPVPQKIQILQSIHHTSRPHGRKLLMSFNFRFAKRAAKRSTRQHDCPR